jgi:hypothetical protein
MDLHLFSRWFSQGDMPDWFREEMKDWRDSSVLMPD